MDIDTAVAVAGESTGGMPATSPLDSTSQMENANGDDWREEVYQKIKSMREMYFSDLNDVYSEIASKEQQNPQNQKIEKFKVHKMSLEHISTFLRLNKHDIQLIHKEQLPLVENCIHYFLRSYKPRKPTSPLPGQLPESSMQQPQTNSSVSRESLFELHERQMLQNEYLRLMYQQPLYSQNAMRQQQLFHRQQLRQQQLMQLFPAHQMSQLHLMTDTNDLTTRQQIGMETGVLQQQQSVGRRVGSLHPHLKSDISSPQLHRALSPQNNLTNLQHNSLSGVSTNSLSCIPTVSNSPQHMINKVQPGSSFDLGQITMQELATGCLQQQQSVGRRVGSLYPQLKSGISSPQLHRALSPQWTEKVKEEGDATLPMEFGPYTSAVEGIKISPIPLDARMGNASGADWQEEVYQKIKSMRETHLLEINDLYQKIASEVQKRPQHEQIEKLKIFKMSLERIVRFLRLNKHEIQLCHKEKLFVVEKYISFFRSCKRPHEPTSSPLQVQLPQPSMHISQAENTYAHQTTTMDSGGQDIASEFDRLLSLID